MSSTETPGHRFRAAIAREQPLQIVGAINAYSAMLAEKAGFRCIYLSGGGVAAASYGLPDLGITALEDVLVDVRRVTAATTLPLLVDIDTGWGGVFNIARTIRELERAGAAGVHIEDQDAQKRCGHRPNKTVVPADEMCARLRAAVTAKTDDDFVVMARTDALAVEGMTSMLQRVQAYEVAGADAIFAEAMTQANMYQQVVESVSIPVLANITEFGKTPLYSIDELKEVGVSMILYPLSAFRAMSKAAVCTYETIRAQGTQTALLEHMQTREELYDVLGYYRFENELDQFVSQEGTNG